MFVGVCICQREKKNMSRPLHFLEPPPPPQLFTSTYSPVYMSLTMLGKLNLMSLLKKISLLLNCILSSFVIIFIIENVIYKNH